MNNIDSDLEKKVDEVCEILHKKQKDNASIFKKIEESQSSKDDSLKNIINLLKEDIKKLEEDNQKLRTQNTMIVKKMEDEAEKLSIQMDEHRQQLNDLLKSIKILSL
jgi:hypothetical protein